MFLFDVQQADSNVFQKFAQTSTVAFLYYFVFSILFSASISHTLACMDVLNIMYMLIKRIKMCFILVSCLLDISFIYAIMWSIIFLVCSCLFPASYLSPRSLWPVLFISLCRYLPLIEMTGSEAVKHLYFTTRSLEDASLAGRVCTCVCVCVFVFMFVRWDVLICPTTILPPNSPLSPFLRLSLYLSLTHTHTHNAPVTRTLVTSVSPETNYRKIQFQLHFHHSRPRGGLTNARTLIPPFLFWTHSLSSRLLTIPRSKQDH